MTDNQKIALFFLVCGLCLFGVASCNINGAMPGYSDGERTGVIVKISQKGVFFKSYEGEMNVGSMSSDKNGLMQPVRWLFSTQDGKVAERIIEASRTGKSVTLKYREWLFSPMRISTSYEVFEVIE